MARRTTRREDAAFLSRAFEDLGRAWKPGDACASARGRVPTTLVKIEGEIAHLADGTSVHRSRMRRPYGEE